MHKIYINWQKRFLFLTSQIQIPVKKPVANQTFFALREQHLELLQFFNLAKNVPFLSNLAYCSSAICNLSVESSVRNFLTPFWFKISRKSLSSLFYVSERIRNLNSEFHFFLLLKNWHLKLVQTVEKNVMRFQQQHCRWGLLKRFRCQLSPRNNTDLLRWH